MEGEVFAEGAGLGPAAVCLSGGIGLALRDLMVSSIADLGSIWPVVSS